MGVVSDFFSFLVALWAKFIVDALTLALAPFVFCLERHRARPSRQSPLSIVITGASSGIGRALAIEWASPGVKLTLTARDAVRLAEVRACCVAKGAEVFVECADVACQPAMASIITRAERRSPLDLVVANAGVSASSLAPVLGSRELDLVAAPMLATNVQGVWNSVLPALPAMRARRSGQIVIVASAASFTPLPGSLSYHATKMAARGLGEGLRAVLARDNIGVTVLCPGLVESGMTVGERGCITAEAAARVFRDGIERDVGIVSATHERTVWTAWVVGSLHPVLQGALFGLIATSRDALKQLGPSRVSDADG